MIELSGMSSDQIKSIYAHLISRNLIKFEIPDEILEQAGIDPKKMSPDQLKVMFAQLAEKGLLKGEKKVRVPGHQTKKGYVKTYYRAGKEAAPKDKAPGTKMTPDNVESITSLSDMNIFGGLNRFFTHVVNFKDNTKGIYKTTDMGSIQGEVNVQSIQSILGWDIAPETVTNDFGKDFGSCQRFINGDIELGLSFTPEGEIEEKVKEDQYDNCAKIFVMDLLCGNPDRRKNNVKVDSSGKVWAIDNDIWGRKSEYTPNVKRDFHKCNMRSWLMFNTNAKKATFQKYVDEHIDNIIEHEQEISDHFMLLTKDVDKFKPQPEKEDGNPQTPISERIQNIKGNLAIIIDYGQGERK